LSLHDVPQSIVQFGKIRTMDYAGKDDGDWAAGEVKPGLWSGMCSNCYAQLLWSVWVLHCAATINFQRHVSLSSGINGTI
jgi:hypothetical protein